MEQNLEELNFILQKHGFEIVKKIALLLGIKLRYKFIG